MTIRTLLLAGAAGSILAAAPLAIVPAMAQTQTPAASMPSSNAVKIDHLVGKPVRNAEGNKIGDIDSVYVTPTGQIDSVIVGVGGFLGMGERDVAVKWSDLTVSADGETITSNMTKDSLKKLPAFSYKDQEYRGKVFSDTGVYSSDRSPSSVATMPGKPGEMHRGDMAKGEMARGGMQRTERMDRMHRDEFHAFTKTGEMSGHAIIGASVINAENEKIGDIEDIHVGNDGVIRSVVIGVGGFLGMGERNVLVSWNNLTFEREAKGDDLVVRTTVTKDSLKSMPEYQM